MANALLVAQGAMDTVNVDGWIHFRCCETSDERGISTEPSSEWVSSAFFPLFLQCLL